MVSVPADLAGIDAEWLSASLSAEGRWGSVAVKRFAVQPSQIWNVAQTAFVTLQDVTAAPDLPRHLFVKLRLEPDPLAALFPGELAFYQAYSQAGMPIPSCLVAVRAPDEASCLLLEDLSHTHEPVPWPGLPEPARATSAAQALAQVHAASLQPVTTALADREARLGKIVADMLPQFLDVLAGRMPPDRVTRVREACLRVPELKRARYQTSEPVVAIHGDMHPRNALYPKRAGHAVLIDWEDWRVDFAALDLA